MISVTKGKITALIFGIIIALVLAEVGARFLEKEHQYPPYMHLYPKPYVMFTGRPEASGMISTDVAPTSDEDLPFKLNEFGFRSNHPFVKEKKEGVMRIAMLGGSTVFQGAPFSKTIIGYLEQMMKDDGKNIEVMNFGAVSYVTGQELSLLLHTVSDFKPDLVIVYDGGNDITIPHGGDPRPGYPYNFMAYETGLEYIRGETTAIQLVGLLLRKSALVRKFFDRPLQDNLVQIKKHRRAVKFGSKGWEQAIADAYVSNVEKMCIVGKGFDSKVAIFLQPLFGVSLDSAGEYMATNSEDKTHAYATEQYKRLKSLIKELDEKYVGEGCSYGNLSDLFQREDKGFYWDFIHTNNAGNEIIARRMYEELKAKGMIDWRLP
jgi:lysophospholipase L1-like esterase